MPTSDRPDALAFAQLLLNLLDEGRRTATYKLAVLLALIDCCAVGTDASGTAPDVVATRDLARRVLELYWPQVRDDALPAGSAVVLRQSSQPRAVTVDAVRRLRTQAHAVRATTPAAAERLLPGDFSDALDLIELNLVQMPLGKLQRPLGFSEAAGRDYPRFLYDDSVFHERVSARGGPGRGPGRRQGRGAWAVPRPDLPRAGRARGGCLSVRSSRASAGDDLDQLVSTAHVARVAGVEPG